MTRACQLAAVMFTDIEGYTALLQQNEEKAIQVRNKHRQIFNTNTEKHQGRILQYYRDDVIVTSRLESLDVTGCVLISDMVCDEIKNQESLEISLQITFKLKNIERPPEV